MPAVSKAQQRFMGMVHAADKGETPASPEVAKVSKNMDDKAAKDFASTKHKGLPDHVKEVVKEIVRGVIRGEGAFGSVIGGAEDARNLTEMSPNDVHFKTIIKLYDRGGSFTKKKVGVVISRNPNASRNRIIDDLRDMDYHEIIDAEDELGIKEIVEKRIRESVNEGKIHEWKLQLDLGNINPSEFENWASDSLQKKHKIKVNGSGKNWTIVGKGNDDRMGSSADWITQLLGKAWTNNKIKVVQKESVNEISYTSDGNLKVKKQYKSVSDYEKVAKSGDYVWVGNNPNDFKGIGKNLLSKVLGKDSEGNAILTPFGKNKKYTIPQKGQSVIVVESINESVVAKDGKVLSNGNLIGYYEFDRGSDSFWVDDVVKGKGQKSFETKKEVEDYYKKNEKLAIKHLGKLRHESIKESTDCGCNINHDCGCGGLHQH